MDTLRRRAATARLLTRARSEPRPPASGELDQLAARVQAALPRYALGEPLGRGGSSVVFAAHEERLGREVALKVFVDLPGSEPAARERFAREARAMAGLAHPNVVVIHDFGQAGELDWIAMERIDGVTLRQLLLDGPLDVEEFAGIALPLLDGLQFAHSRGVVHRDVKPENILLDAAGHVKVCDFGIAKWAGPQTHWQTHSGVALGTPRYIAPEQIEAPATVDERADVFALGVVLYEMLTGEVPAGHFEPPSQRAGAPVALDKVILRAMSRERSARQANVVELRTELLAALQPVPTPNPTPKATPAPALQPTLKSPPGWIDLALFLLVFLACIVPDVLRHDSMLSRTPVTLLLIGAWLVGWLSNMSDIRILKIPIQSYVHVAVSLFTAVFLAFFLTENAHDLTPIAPIPIILIGIAALFSLLKSAERLILSSDPLRAPKFSIGSRASGQRKVEKTNDPQILKLWESSVGWDWIVAIVSAMTFLPGLHEDGHLMKEAIIWLFFPGAALFQAIAVGESLDSGKSAGAAVYRMVGGTLLLLFGTLWAVTDGVDDLERSGQIVFGLMLATSFISLFSGIDWWQRLKALGLLEGKPTEPAEEDGSGD